MVPGRTVHTSQDVIELPRHVASSAPSPCPPIVVSREPWPSHLITTKDSLPDLRHPRVRLPTQQQPAARKEARPISQTAMFCKQVREINVDASLPGTHQVATSPRVSRKRVRAENLWDRDEDERQRRAEKLVSTAPANIVTSQLEPVNEQTYTTPDQADLFNRPERQGRIGWVLPKFSQGLHRPSGTGHSFGQLSVNQPSISQFAELDSAPHPLPNTTYLILTQDHRGFKRSKDSLNHGSDTGNKAQKTPTNPSTSIWHGSQLASTPNAVQHRLF
jgi:hypothetical protein